MDAFDVIRSPRFGAILVLGLVLLTIFPFWLFAANMIYCMIFGDHIKAATEVLISIIMVVRHIALTLESALPKRGACFLTDSAT